MPNPRNVPDDTSRNCYIEVFDSNKIGVKPVIEGDIGENPPIMKKRGSVGPKSSFIRDDPKEELSEDKLVMTLVKAKDLIKSDLTGKSNHGSQQHETPVAEITNEPGQEGRGCALAGTKSGLILLKSEFIEKIGNNSRGLPST